MFTTTIYNSSCAVIFGTYSQLLQYFWDLSLILGPIIMSDLEEILKQIREISLDEEAWRRWRRKHKKQYQKWAYSETKCPHCGKMYTNKHKSTHMKSKKCRKSRGLRTSPRKTRSDKGKVRL